MFSSYRRKKLNNTNTHTHIIAFFLSFFIRWQFLFNIARKMLFFICCYCLEKWRKFDFDWRRKLKYQNQHRDTSLKLVSSFISSFLFCFFVFGINSRRALVFVFVFLSFSLFYYLRIFFEVTWTLFPVFDWQIFFFP